MNTVPTPAPAVTTLDDLIDVSRSELVRYANAAGYSLVTARVGSNSCAVASLAEVVVAALLATASGFDVDEVLAGPRSRTDELLDRAVAPS